MKKYANVDEFGTGVVENPYRPAHGFSDGTPPKWHEFANSHPPLKVYTKSNELVTNCRVEVEGPVYEIWEPSSGGFWTSNCKQGFRSYAEFCSYYWDIETRQIYLAVEAEKEQVKEDIGWIEISDTNLPNQLLICEWKYKENKHKTEFGNLVPYNDPKGNFLGWFVYPVDGMADICIDDFSHYRKPVKAPISQPVKEVKSAEEIASVAEDILMQHAFHQYTDKDDDMCFKITLKDGVKAMQEYAQFTNSNMGEVEKVNRWVKVSEVMPPFDTLILLRGLISWKSKNSISYFSDVVKNDYEILEYGQSGYLLENNSDYLVVNHPNPEEVCSEYITHWRPINEPAD